MREYCLDELFELQMGKTPSRNNPAYWNNGIKDWISIGDLSGFDKYVGKTKEQLTDSAISESGIKAIPADTVVMSFKLSIGKLAITTEEIYSNEAIMAFIDKNVEKISPDYLYYLLLSKDWSEGTNKAVMGKTLNKATLSKVKIKLHEFKDQEEIVAVLDKASNLIVLRKQQLEDLNNLIKSRFVEMFGDPITNSKKMPLIHLGEACNMKAGKGIKASDITDEFEEGMYPCYGGNGLRGYTIDYTHEGTIPLIGRQGALCGNVQYAEGKFYATEHAVVTQPKIDWNPCWLFIMLREMNLNRLATGAAQPGLNVSTLVPIDVINPPLYLQNQFATFVQQVDKLKFDLQKSFDETQILFDSLLQKYFG